MTRQAQAEREAAIERLRELGVKPGVRLFTTLAHKSTSGMYRAINVYLLTSERDRIWLSRLVATATGSKFDERREAVGVSGAGMDMGFHLIYNLSYTMFPKGFRCTGEHCPSNDHSNGMARPHKFPAEWAGNPVDPAGTCPVWYRGRPGDRCGLTAAEHPTKRKQHRDGGYAVSQEWL